MSTPTIESSWIFAQITAEQYDAMPVEQCRGIEIVDGMVHVSPKPTPYHNDLAVEIRNHLMAAGKPDWRATTDVDLRLRDVPLLNRQPDVIVYEAGTPRDRIIPVAAVLAVVEIVSPGSTSTDRIAKPAEYAEAGIPFYWRVEIVGGQPVVHTYALDQAAKVYRDAGVFNGVVKTRLTFPVEIDLTDI